MASKREDYKSRKLWMSWGCIWIVTGYGVFAAYVPAAGGLYPTLIGGILGAAGIYVAGNITEKRLVPTSDGGDK
jgi:hypothetical protein